MIVCVIASTIPGISMNPIIEIAQLSLNLAMLGSLTIVVAHHMYSMPLIHI
ncbi:unnamed protein product [Linum tenue]|uniref:NADH:ubiquinone reductase (H(+)-translocating) n=1 Tax=Linum tenue TaxID=586396 RepID=A0AAV0LAU6_9ROSI|nr:unnamed protein product [Linum tenue]